MSASPAYIIADIQINDHAAYEEYKQQVSAIVNSFGGEYLARGGEMRIDQDELWTPTRIVLLKFPSIAQANAFLSSDEYAPIKKIRTDNSQGTILTIEGI